MSVFDTPALPDSLAELTPRFLMSILHSAGVLGGATIIEIQVEPLVPETGFNAQLARLHLKYSEYEEEAPRSLFAKLPTVKEELHQRAAVFQPGMKECWFYRHGVARTPLHVPKCYYNAVDPATGESFLLLEDLALARVGSRLAGASLEEAEVALRSISRLHAAWWAVDLAFERELAQLMRNRQEARDLVERLYQDAWPRFLKSTLLEIPEDVRRLGESMVGRISAVEALLDHSPQTLIHGDFRLENMLFGERNQQMLCWVIDWEDITLSNGMVDVAWFLGGCLPAEVIDKEQELLRNYHRAMLQAGIEGYSWEQCFSDYRYSMLGSFVQGILTVASLNTDDDYARNLARVLTERFIMACRRMRLVDLQLN